MLNKKILILSIFLISLVSCSSKSSFTDLKAHTDMEKTLKEPISKKSIDEKIFKDEKNAKILKNFKITVDNLTDSTMVEKTELKEESPIEFNFEGKKYGILVQNIQEFESINKDKKPEERQKTPLIYIKKYEKDKAVLHKLSFNNTDGESIYKIATLISEQLKK